MVPDDSTPATPDPADEPVSLEQLAELQAGLLDDDAAARLRRRIRDDPELARHYAALDQVRRDVAGLQASSPADIPSEVSTQVTSALRGASGPTHSARPPHRRRVAALIGLAAVAIAIAVGTVVALDESEQPPPAAGPTAEYLKAPRHTGMPLADHQIVELLSHPPIFGPLADPDRRAACLRGLGYAGDTAILGATPVEAAGIEQVLLLLPATAPRTVMALLVTAGCNASDAGLIADAAIARP